MKHVTHSINTFLKLFLVLFFATCYVLRVTPVNAQQITLSLSPPLVETVIKPGKSMLIAYTINNLGDPLIVKAKILPFTAQDNYGNIRLKDEFEGPIRFSLDNSVIKLEESFFLKSKETEQLLLRIRIPEGAPDGDYYYTLLVETQPPPSLDGTTGSQAKATIGSNILITVTESGNIDVRGKIAIFNILPKIKLNLFGKQIKIFDSNDKIPVVLIVANDGQNVAKSHGEILLTGNFDEKATYDIIPQNILSQSQRLIIASPSATIVSKTPTSLVLNGFFIGRYNLLANVYFDDGQNIFSAKTSFIALPFKIIMGIILAIFIGIVIHKKIR